MKMEKMKKITISGKEYPIRFDYMTLKAVSEKYPSIHKFEMELLGLESDGFDENGIEKLKKAHDPSISCLIFLTPLMVNTALDYLNIEMVDEKQIVKEIDLNFIELANILHEEMNRCFQSSIQVKKKYIPKVTK